MPGAGGDYSDWIRKVPAIREYSDRYGILIVCPDGNVTSWYFDSPADPAWRYETYVSRELVKWIDAHYPTVRDRRGRAITGLSMSGGVDLRPFLNNWDIAKRLGDLSAFPGRWDSCSVVNLVYLLRPGALTLMMDCGTEDFFYTVNGALHEKLMAAKIPHDFISRPGAHNWEYWANAVQFQLVFIHRYFESGSTGK